MNEIIAIICEYNPFHKGHKYQIDSLKKIYPDATLISIMSGNATQRGEVALFDKYARAKAAVLCGVDCVFELPYPYCASNAERFAMAGVYIAAQLGATHLCFGTESGSIDYVKSVADAIDSAEFENEIGKELQNKKISYANARSNALERLGVNPPKKSNDILGVEYIRAIKKYNSAITPITIKREGSDYNNLDVSDIMSASAIREYFLNNNSITGVPNEIESLYKELIEDGQYTDKNEIDNYLFRSLILSSPDEISRCYDVPEGAEYFIYDTALNSKNSAEFFTNLTTKTYTYARLRRIVLYSALKTYELDSEPAYTALLGASEKGRAFLKQIKKATAFPILTKLADYKNHGEKVASQFEEASKLDKVFNAFLKNKAASTSYIKKTPFISM